MNLKEVVNNFLNAQVLVLNLTDTSPKIEFRLTEIEFYLYSVTHPDPYTHRAEEQKYKNRFYFHKFSNGTFKSGTWKGLDICLGNGDSYFGALIRSITDIGTGRPIEGPCLTVNRILDHFGSGNVREFIDKVFGGKLDFDIYDESKPVHLRRSSGLQQETIFTGPRIGLSNKWPEFRDRHYRFCIYRDRLKKKKTSLVKLK